jgi:hypothetical protein
MSRIESIYAALRLALRRGFGRAARISASRMFSGVSGIGSGIGFAGRPGRFLDLRGFI